MLTGIFCFAKSTSFNACGRMSFTGSIFFSRKKREIWLRVYTIGITLRRYAVSAQNRHRETGPQPDLTLRAQCPGSHSSRRNHRCAAPIGYSLRSGGHRERIADGASEKAQLRPIARALHWQTHAIEGIFPALRPNGKRYAMKVIKGPYHGKRKPAMCWQVLLITLAAVAVLYIFFVMMK